VKFWDASALVPLLIDERTSARIRSVMEADQDVLTWWGSEIECASVLARLERSQDLSSDDVAHAYRKLALFRSLWEEIEPTEVVREAAIRFLRVHPLRAADALQIAAAYVGADRRPPSLEVVTLDDRLAEAMRKEGFVVVDIG
jgi:predicted nucleic acid-binding protein